MRFNVFVRRFVRPAVSIWAIRGVKVVFNVRPNLKAENGFSLIEAVVAIGISGIVVLGSSTLVEQSIHGQREAEKAFWISQRRQEFQSVLKSDLGWTQAVAANPNMACFDAGTSCAAFSTPQPLNIDFDGTALNGSDATLGMKNDGGFCTGYTDGSGACTVGMTLNWQAICDTPACLHAQPKMFIQFRGPNLNGASYTLNVYRDARLASLDEVCQAMNGTLVGTNCNLPATNCDPATGNFLLGFDGRGVAVCGRPNPGTCAGSDVGVGFDPSGGIVCAPSCP